MRSEFRMLIASDNFQTFVVAGGGGKYEHDVTAGKASIALGSRDSAQTSNYILSAPNHRCTYIQHVQFRTFISFRSHCMLSSSWEITFILFRCEHTSPFQEFLIETFQDVHDDFSTSCQSLKTLTLIGLASENNASDAHRLGLSPVNTVQHTSGVNNKHSSICRAGCSLTSIFCAS